MSKMISYAFCLIVATLVVFAFSPRSEQGELKPETDLGRLQINDLVDVEGRLVAVGERGAIMISDDQGQTWRTTHGDEELPVTLTSIARLGGQRLLAVGHDESMLRSEDSGETWEVVMHSSSAGEPLMGVWTADGQEVLAYGSFGRFLRSSDGGRTWAPQELDIHGEHLNDMVGDGKRLQMMVGEMGLLLRSEDQGHSWQVIEPFYRGSLFGVAHLRDQVWVTYGMRGHVFVTHDDGVTWAPVKLPHRLPLYGHAVNGDEIVIVGTAGAYVNINHRGEVTDQGFFRELGTLTSAVMLPNDELFVAGQRGLVQPGKGYLAVIGK